MSTWGCVYLTVAVLVTAYQTYRGFMFQVVLADKERWPQRHRLWLLYLADAILYLASTAAGFLALYFAYAIAQQIEDFTKIGAGASFLLIFLALFGLLGLTGQLPHLLQQGKLLPKN